MSNHKSFWTEKEENNLLHEIQLNLSLEEIAERHQRTKTAIELRFALLLEKKLKSGEKRHRLAQEYNISDSEISRFLTLLDQKKKYETEGGNWKQMEKDVGMLCEKMSNVEKLLLKITKKLGK